MGNREQGMKKFKSLCGSWLIFILIFLAFLSACSSAPRQTGEVFIDRNMAHDHLNLANQTANHGRFEEALIILQEARRLAVSTDDPSLRIRTSASRGNVLFFLGRHEEAFRNGKTQALREMPRVNLLWRLWREFTLYVQELCCCLMMAVEQILLKI